ncbi:MAG: PEP-CTERM sorting domain-containing protein, partial [Candidatus Desulfofervidus auxilii]|nr:PEP-CTERM sorting domain-containing protein [Candidatus Desulfofervidus auxilii]
ADLVLDLNLDGTYEYGVKLTHTGPNDGDYSAALYKDGTWKSSYDVLEGNTINNLYYGEFYPEPTSKREAWVKMEGGTKKGDVTINISSSPSGLWEWTLTIDKNLFESGDLDNQMGIFWATGTCANDVVQGAVVPIPTTILLLGSGLLGFGLLSRRKKVNT